MCPIHDCPPSQCSEFHLAAADDVPVARVPAQARIFSAETHAIVDQVALRALIAEMRDDAVGITTHSRPEYWAQRITARANRLNALLACAERNVELRALIADMRERAVTVLPVTRCAVAKE